MSNFDNHFKKDTILEKTKNSVNNLINYNDKFKNNVQYPGEPLDEMKIKQLLLPVYDKIYEIKEDLLLFSELNSKNNSKNISTKKFNEMQHLHTNILFNKNIIDDTLNYMKEKIDNINYEQINKEFQEIEITLETLKKEMEDMVEEFNNKYEKIIKEKKRQKIAEDLMKGNYKNIPEGYNKGLQINAELKNKLEDDEENGAIDYNKYKHDINEINDEKENLMIQYLEDKQKAINGLPQMVPPYQKVNFDFDDLTVPNFKNLDNNNHINSNRQINNNNIMNNKIDAKNIKDNDFKQNINFNNNKKNNIKEINSNIQIDNASISGINNNINNDNNINMNPISKNNKKIDKSDINIIEESKNNIPQNFYMKSDYNNEDENDIKERDNIDPTETLNNFKKKMSEASKAILTGPTKINKDPKSKKKLDPNNVAYESYMRNIQPKSSASKISYQNFNKPKKPKKVIKNEFIKKPYKYNTGKYPEENEKNRINEFLEKNPSRPVNKNLRIFEQENLEEEIKRIVDINIKKAFSTHQLNKNTMDSSRIRKNNTGSNNDELLKVLIEKFDDIENAIRETKNNNNGNGIEYKQDINEMLANEIFNKIYAQIYSKIHNINIRQRKPESESEEEEKEESENEIIQKKDNIEKPEQINIFNEDLNKDLKDLDEVIPAPRDLNLNKYNDISISSEPLSESMKRKPDINNQIEITNINIKKNKFLFNENQVNYNSYLNKKNIIDNSLSEGEERTNKEESSQSDFDNYNNKFKTAKNFMPNQNKNKTGNDLLLLKYQNENMPEVNLNKNNIKNINFNDEPKINLNNNKLLKNLDIYDSGEYNVFKNSFLENMNNNKMLNNFESMKNPYNQNNLDFDLQNLKIVKHNEKDMDDIKRKIELIKMKNDQDNEINNNSNNIGTNNYNNNYNNKIRKSDDGDSSPGEVRDEDSY